MTVTMVSPRQDTLEKSLERGIAKLGLELDGEMQTRLLEHLALLEKWNRVHNLTAIRDKEKAVSVHLLDSLATLPYITGKRLLDAGSGAGFPGIPIAVAKSEIHVDLLDGSQKKCAFLKQAIAELRLKNASVVCERAESWHPAAKFDCIVSRALADIAEIVGLTQHLLAPGGVIAAMKGVHPFEEIERIPSGFRVREVHALAVPGLDAQRHLVMVERT